MPLTSFFSALSGLDSNSFAISTIGNNLANVNTVAFKGSRVNFKDLINANVGSRANGAPMQVGLGVQLAGIQTVLTQGGVQPTNNPTDLAVQGNGLFVLGANSAGTGNPLGIAFSRAGNFSIDRLGNLVNPDNLPVLGYVSFIPGTNGVINTNAPLQPVKIPTGSQLPPRSSTFVQINWNLDAGAALNSTYNTSMQVFDSLGSPHVITYTFRKTSPVGSPPSFGFDVTVDGGEVTGGTSGVPFSLLTGAPASIPPPGTMNFNSNGRLASITGVPTISPTNFNIQFPPSDITFTNGARITSRQVTWNIENNPGVDPSNRSFNITAFSAPSSTASTSQDGFSSGSLTSISVSSLGVVQGIFSNGQISPIAQLALANFPNPEGLVKSGNNIYLASPTASGDPLIGVAGTAGRGTLISSSLELSNVDIAQEFTKLITAQRGYQASSRVILTTDEILQETINLKR